MSNEKPNTEPKPDAPEQQSGAFLAAPTGYAACFVAGLSVANLPAVISGERPVSAYIIFLVLAWLPVAAIAIWRHNDRTQRQNPPE